MLLRFLEMNTSNIKTAKPYCFLINYFKKLTKCDYEIEKCLLMYTKLFYKSFQSIVCFYKLVSYYYNQNCL